MEDILDLDATALSERIRDKSITCVQVMEATLDRIEQLNPQVNAIINLADRSKLIQRAQEYDSAPRKGWLHGIPIAIKDLSNAQGFPTTMGGSMLSQWLSPSPATANDEYVQRLVDEGAIVIGKTNAPEYGLGSHTFNSVWGVTRNPYHVQRSAGGSSGGAAVALATRMLSVVDGSDKMGSLRNPAGWNNHYSLRPTAGNIVETTAPKPILPYPLSTVGPMARTPRDLQKLLQNLTPPTTATVIDDNDDKQKERTIQQRIGWLGDWGGAYPMEEGILDICHSSLQQQEGLFRVTTVEEPLFDSRQLWASWTTIRADSVLQAWRLSAGVVGSLVLRLLLSILPPNLWPIKGELVWELQQGLKITPSQLNDAIQVAQEWSNRLDRLFQEEDKFDVLALPSAQVWPFPVDWNWPRTINHVEMDTYHRWMEVTVPCSLAGLPCVTLPAGFHKGLPMGIQILGPRGSDSKLLAIAQAYHESIDWPSQRRPPLLDECQSRNNPPT